MTVDASADRFENSHNGVSCALTYENAEVLPLHRFDLPGAPVTAYKARGFIYAANGKHCTEWRGPRRETLTEAAADAERFMS